MCPFTSHSELTHLQEENVLMNAGASKMDLFAPHSRLFKVSKHDY